MPLKYRLGNPGVSSISVDGREHKVNSDGFLEIEDRDVTPALVKEVEGHYGGRQHKPEADGPPSQGQADEDDRTILFARLDAIFGRKIDRRKSLQQLQEMLTDHERRQSRTEGASKALATQPPGDQPQENTEEGHGSS